MSAIGSIGLMVCLPVLAGGLAMDNGVPAGMSEVMPGPDEALTVDRAVIIADASSSMLKGGKFDEEKGLVEMFVAGMPSGNYDASLNSFSGTDKSRWMRNPLSVFNRGRLAGYAMDLENIGDLTTLGMAITEWYQPLYRPEGKTAVIIFSDGMATRRDHEVIAAAERLRRYHGHDLCIHTVHFGDKTRGRQLLQSIADVTDCGSMRLAADISSHAGMEQFIRDVFFEKRPAPMPPPRLDTDGDGVYDDEDQCPGTPQGASVNARGCWVLQDLNFDVDMAVIKPQFQPIIDEVATVLKNNPGVRIRIEGHTDSDGSDAYNQALSQRRATAVLQALVQRGIAADRLTATGFGEAQPMVPNTSRQNKYMNRRVVLTPLQ